jgi:hypothetical protein
VYVVINDKKESITSVERDNALSDVVKEVE